MVLCISLYEWILQKNNNEKRHLRKGKRKVTLPFLHKDIDNYQPMI